MNLHHPPEQDNELNADPQAPGPKPLHVRLSRGLAGGLDEEEPQEGEHGGEVRGTHETPQEEDVHPLPTSAQM